MRTRKSVGADDIVVTSRGENACINCSELAERMIERARRYDQIDRRSSPQIGAPHFDDSLNAWVLSRYADVLAAFHCASLYPAGSGIGKSSAPPQENAMAQMRKDTRDALSPAQLRVWRRGLSSAARSLAGSLAIDAPVDLNDTYARPLCLMLAATVTNIGPHQAERLRNKAEPISASAAEPFDASLKASARAVNQAIRECFRSGPEPLRDSGFVALAHTLPCLLANAWLALLACPQQWTTLHREPRGVERAIEELLRCSGLPRILFRRASNDVEFNGVRIRKGERIVLQVLAANHDPENFAHPHRLDVKRRRIRQLTFGAGPHACVGAGLIRMAAVTITRPLLERFSAARLSEPVDWKGGSGFRFPGSLRVSLSINSNRRNRPE
jgi:cytochrome P450